MTQEKIALSRLQWRGRTSRFGVGGSRSVARPDTAGFRCVRLTGRLTHNGNGFGASAFHEALGPIDLVGRFAVYRKQDSAFLHAGFVVLGFVVGKAEANKQARKSTNRAAHAGAREGRHDRSRSDERAESRNGQR